MSELADPTYHLLLNPEEIPVITQALRLLITDEAHEPEIRKLARTALAGLSGHPDDGGVLRLALSPEEMKITHTALKLELDDTQREQKLTRETLRGILEKLPDEHAIRAIALP